MGWVFFFIILFFVWLKHTSETAFWVVLALTATLLICIKIYLLYKENKQKKAEEIMQHLWEREWAAMTPEEQAEWKAQQEKKKADQERITQEWEELQQKQEQDEFEALARKKLKNGRPALYRISYHCLTDDPENWYHDEVIAIDYWEAADYISTYVRPVDYSSLMGYKVREITDEELEAWILEEK